MFLNDFCSIPVLIHAYLFWKEIRIIRRLPSLDAWATLPRISPKMRVCLKTIYFRYNYPNYSNFFPKIRKRG